jgi:hypothetical protein
MAANDERVPGFGGTQGYGMFVPAHGVYSESATKQHPLGTVMRLGSRTFVYAQASEALSKGKLATALPTLFTEDTVTVAHAAGTRKVTITASATITAGQLEDGLLIVDEGTAAGDQYLIKSNPAITNATTGEIELYDGLMTAWAVGDTDVTILTSPWRVQESNTTQVEKPMGVPLISVTDEYYFWLCTWGVCGILMDEVAGNAAGTRQLVIGSSTAGAVEAYDGVGEAVVGECLLSAADVEDAKYMPVFLQLQR